MENKKLIKILLKDMAELGELIGEVKASGRFDALEMEFIHTRAKGLQQLLQLLESKGKSHIPAVDPGKAVAEQKEMGTTEIGQEIGEGAQNDQATVKTEVSIENGGSRAIHEKEVEPEEEQMEDKSRKGTREAEKQDEMLEEDSPKSEANSRLGDSFLKGKSVNDLITDQNKLEFKLSNRPVSSIQTAIGINDRFQYIRELFEGDTEKFVSAVKTLDSKQNIKEAVDYLRTNFKWKKNETSLKFVNLVKRRFQE
jgi:hypothetical protein